MKIENPYLMFLGDAADQLAAKTAHGVADWRRDWCLGQLRMDGCKADLGLPDMTIEAAVAAGVKTLVIGVANRGGIISDRWIDILEAALIAGMDVAAGLHNRLADVPRLAAAASQHGRHLFDVRHPAQIFDVGNGRKRAGKRLLAVGTDCAVGKMYTTLAIEKEMRERGMNVDFRATGQTGILIAGDGISVDAVVADFISGAVEWLSPANTPDHWDLIEGQGSLFHASFAGVSLGLIHGAQPDAIILCHEPTRDHMRGLPEYSLPDLGDCIETNLAAARLTNPAVMCAGVSINTSRLDADDARRLLSRFEDNLGLPVVDTFRDGAGSIVDRLN
ncbi:MAG: N-acetyltransferase DgcN [Alphaproteobacteria bacterium]